MLYDHELSVAVDIARQAGAVMRQYSHAEQSRSIKSDGTPVTLADTTINRLVIESLQAAFPGDIVIGEEESTGTYGMGRRWLCDPVDGTKAFTWGVPTAMFSLALVVDGRPVVGVCYEPMLDQLYTAVAGNGANRNGASLRVNDDTFDRGILAIASAPEDITSNTIVKRILNTGVTTAVFSGAVYKASAVADGRFIGYVEHKVNAYDVAAVELIVTEAGGMATGLDGKQHDYSGPVKGVVVSNGVVHDQLVVLCQDPA